MAGIGDYVRGIFSRSKINDQLNPAGLGEQMGMPKVMTPNLRTQGRAFLERQKMPFRNRYTPLSPGPGDPFLPPEVREEMFRQEEDSMGSITAGSQYRGPRSSTQELMRDPTLMGLGRMTGTQPAPQPQQPKRAPAMMEDVGFDPPIAAPAKAVKPKADAADKNSGISAGEALAAFGFNMAASDSPFWMQAAAQGGKAAMANIKDQKARQVAAMKLQLDVQKMGSEMAANYARAAKDNASVGKMPEKFRTFRAMVDELRTTNPEMSRRDAVKQATAAVFKETDRDFQLLKVALQAIGQNPFWAMAEPEQQEAAFQRMLGTFQKELDRLGASKNKSDDSGGDKTPPVTRRVYTPEGLK